MHYNTSYMDLQENKKIKLHIVLDNIRSAFNVGSIFRSADAVGECHIYLCGITSTVDNPKIYKTALGATKSVSSSHHPDGVQLVESIKKKGIPIYAVELTPESENFQEIDYPDQVALVFGHEIRGVNQMILDLADKKIFIPMKGIKESLNVANSASIVMYESRRGRFQSEG